MTKDLSIIYKGSITIFIGKIVNAVAQFILLFVLGRYLGPTDVGLFFLGLAIMKFGNIGGTLGFQGSLVKFIPEYMSKRQYNKVHSIITFAYLSSFLLSSFIAATLFTLARFLGIYIFDNVSLIFVIKLFSICLPFFSFLTILKTSIRSFRDMFALTIIENFIFPIGLIILTLSFFTISKKIHFVILAHFLSILASIIVGNNYLKKNKPKIIQKIKIAISHKKVLNYSIPFMGSGFVALLILRMDIIMLGVLDNAESVGIYGGAARIAVFTNIILGSINSIFGPTISKLYTKGDLIGLEAAYKATVKWIFHISTPFFIIIFFFPKEIMGIYGDSFTKGYTVLVILSVGQLMNISVGSAGYMLNMTGKPKTEFFNQIVTLFTNFLLNWYLIPLMGINGAALATAISMSVVNLLRLLQNYRHLHIHPYSIGIIFPFIKK